MEAKAECFLEQILAQAIYLGVTDQGDQPASKQGGRLAGITTKPSHRVGEEG